MTQYVVSIKCSILELAWQKQLSVWKVERTGVSSPTHSGVHKSILDMHFPVLPISRIVFCFIHHVTYSLVYWYKKVSHFAFIEFFNSKYLFPSFGHYQIIISIIVALDKGVGMNGSLNLGPFRKAYH
jgi:hypothetical protein